MLEILSDLMNDAVGRCAYAEARHVDSRDEAIAVVNGGIDAIDSSASEGIGVRVRVGGGWGFAATGDVTRAGARAALTRALAVAESQPATQPTPLAPVTAARGHWASPYELDPFAVTLEDKLELLFVAERALRTGDERLVRTVATSRAWRERKAFASTAGAACTQETVACGAGIVAYATDGSDLQVRSYPTAHGGGLSAAAGWEHVLALELAGHAPRVAEEAIALLSAPQCPAGTSTIVLHGEQVALQVHESIGHALELDRILLGEASYAGTSWVGPDDLGSLRYGSDLLHVTADATLPHGLGSFGWDDEGVAAQAVPLVKNGIFVGYLSSRETAPRIHRQSGGAMRADGWNRIPLIRMTNINLLPKPGMSLGEIVADTDDGLYLASNRSWSIDDRRLNFQFATEVAYEIKGGRKGQLFKNPTYTGITYEFWRSCDAVGDERSYVMLGTPNCGKGEPGQTGHVGHAVPGARFRDVQVGVGKW